MLTVAQAANLKHVDPRIIRFALARGAIRGVKGGRDWMVDESSLAAWFPMKRGKYPRNKGLRKKKK